MFNLSMGGILLLQAYRKILVVAVILSIGLLHPWIKQDSPHARVGHAHQLRSTPFISLVVHHYCWLWIGPLNSSLLE